HVAEETGMIVPLWNFILTESCRQLAGWLPFMPDGLRPTIAVNLSATQLNSPGLYRSLENALEITGLPPDLLKIEITESGLMLDYDVTGPLLEKIRTLGCSISIDDFGTGYSSLSYLLRLPVNDIKVDRSFIKVMHDTPINRELVRAIIDMGHLLHKKVVAEGVETAEDLTALRAMGCDHAQGYFFCKPMFAAQVPEYLQKFN
ncbi:MAG: EAL domain-containing protein, partial [Alphaproteobacteria bacterium]|nr:EAL domain-containing protein [Alphaproteobacteria bacterium]